ncbi:Antitoxin VapB32 [Candidatus Methylomirabilis lanthanidiphila]|uniref:Antitoxin VapB32 n=1 Tax=Candidatus Methylomirabilis lanthanidiphila TaxID=2211376 RepID=A0A564ZHU2_9BACT|nr:Antitoxin VapB32 [Candidatus Methylomirabilis lanthanidiphila]
MGTTITALGPAADPERWCRKGRLTGLYKLHILMHMRTTLNIDDGLLKRASQLTGVTEKTALLRLGLEALIALESARRLATLGGTEKALRPIRRRRSAA